MEIKKVIKWILKALSAIMSFVIIFLICQPIFVPKYIDDSTTRVVGYSYLEENSVDVLFLGASQMFCTVDAEKLTYDYDICSFDYGASSQLISTTEFYFEKALETQSPKLVLLEISMIFNSDNATEDTLAWNYAPFYPSIEKYQSLKTVLDGDVFESAEYAFAPLLNYHDRWKSLSGFDFGYSINRKKYINIEHRGYLSRDHIEKEKIAFNANSDGEKRVIPKNNKETIEHILEKCKENNIRLVCFKSPSALWTRNDSNTIKHFMTELNLQYLDLNDYLMEIGIDENIDFYDNAHLNNCGAQKTTAFLAEKIQHSLG